MLNSRVVIALFVFIAAINTSIGLKCYTCNVSTSNLDDDVCRGIGSLTNCAENSVCLSATYKVSDYNIKTYTTVRTCFLKSNGQECESFFKAQKNLRKPGVDMTMESCFPCEKDDCNRLAHPKNEGLKYAPSIFLISLVSFLFMAF